MGLSDFFSNLMPTVYADEEPVEEPVDETPVVEEEVVEEEEEEEEPEDPKEAIFEGIWHNIYGHCMWKQLILTLPILLSCQLL
jgi:hypothetical protein